MSYENPVKPALEMLEAMQEDDVVLRSVKVYGFA